MLINGLLPGNRIRLVAPILKIPQFKASSALRIEGMWESSPCQTLLNSRRGGSPSLYYLRLVLVNLRFNADDLARYFKWMADSAKEREREGNDGRRKRGEGNE